MYFPSDDDLLIVEAAIGGDLQTLQQLAVRTSASLFRKRCEIAKNCEGRTALHYAAAMGRIQICRFLIEKVKVDIDIKTERGDSPLQLAIIGEQTYTAKYLIIRGADIAMRDSRGATSLHYAAGKGNLELMQSLLLKGACIEGKSVDGTPLQFAASCGSVKSVRFLLNRGADPNSVAPLTRSPILLAIISHSFECLGLLLKAGADPNLNSFGTSPLACAAMEGESDGVKSLLAAGANPNAVCKPGLTPIEVAAVAGKNEVVRILFPVTRCIPDYTDWSIDGIVKYVHSEKAKKKSERRISIHLKMTKQKGFNAMRRNNYSDAIKWYNEASYIDSSDAELLLKRSFCWAYLGEAALALSDAEACVQLRPHWAWAHYAEGVAWRLCKNYLMSTEALKEACGLDPTDRQIGKVFEESTRLSIMDFAAKYPMEALMFCQMTGAV